MSRDLWTAPKHWLIIRAWPTRLQVYFSLCQALFGGLSVRNRFLMVGHGQPLLRYFYTSQQRALARLLCDQSRGRVMYIRHEEIQALTQNDAASQASYRSQICWTKRMLWHPKSVFSRQFSLFCDLRHLLLKYTHYYIHCIIRCTFQAYLFYGSCQVWLWCQLHQYGMFNFMT